MKSIIVFFILMLSSCIKAQSFEGKLKYLVSNEAIGDSLVQGICKKNMIEKLESQGEIPIDTLTYIYSANGDFVTVSKFDNINVISNFIKKNNLLYTFIGDLNIVSAIDVTIDLEEILGDPPTVIKLDKKEKIGDLECSIVEVKWKTGSYRYYFSNNILKIDSEVFKGYNYDQFYKFLKISNALPVKIEKIINNFLKSTFILYSFTNQKIDKVVFTIPKMREDKTMSNLYINKKFFTIK